MHHERQSHPPPQMPYTHIMRRVLRSAGAAVAAVMVLVLNNNAARAASDGKPPATLSSVDEIVARMTEMNQRRAEALRAYTVTRRYFCENKRVHKEADLIATMNYTYPDKKEFTVVSRSGSGILQKLVLNRAMESEKEAARADMKKISDINPNNYNFELLNIEQEDGRTLYLLNANPKAPSKYRFRGRIWVDAVDFAIVRVQGEPSQNPSWWIKHVEIVQDYEKVGRFWLPLRIRSVSQIRIFGKSVFTIDSSSYQLHDGQTREDAPPAN
jgi:hypothetical protein